jgi:hypothetical protein
MFATTLNWKTPIEALTGITPDINSIYQVFYCAEVHFPLNDGVSIFHPVPLRTLDILSISRNMLDIIYFQNSNEGHQESQCLVRNQTGFLWYKFLS